MSAPKESVAAVLMSLYSKAPKDVSPPREVLPNPTPPPGRLPTPAVAPPVPVQRSISSSASTAPIAAGLPPIAAGLPAASVSLAMPPMLRAISQTRGVSTSAPTAQSWHSLVSIEERQMVRNQIKEACRKTCPDYQSLLAVVSAIDEELLYSNAITRIDYFKAGIDWDARLTLKRKQLAGQFGASSVPGSVSASFSSSSASNTANLSSSNSPPSSAASLSSAAPAPGSGKGKSRKRRSTDGTQGASTSSPAAQESSFPVAPVKTGSLPSMDTGSAGSPELSAKTEQPDSNSSSVNDSGPAQDSSPDSETGDEQDSKKKRRT